MFQIFGNLDICLYDIDKNKKRLMHISQHVHQYVWLSILICKGQILQVSTRSSVSQWYAYAMIGTSVDKNNFFP